MDLEMTGLEADRHVIVEIATLVTDDDLVVVAEGPDLVVHASEERARRRWTTSSATCTRRVDCWRRSGASDLTLEEAGRQTLEFIRAHVPKPRTVPLAGNSIGTDRRFLAAHLPEIEEYLHYRSVDVSTVKELAGSLVPRRSDGCRPTRPVATGPWTTSANRWPSWPTTGPRSSRTPPPDAADRAPGAGRTEREEHPWQIRT